MGSDIEMGRHSKQLIFQVQVSPACLQLYVHLNLTNLVSKWYDPKEYLFKYILLERLQILLDFLFGFLSTIRVLSKQVLLVPLPNGYCCVSDMSINDNSYWKFLYAICYYRGIREDFIYAFHCRVTFLPTSISVFTLFVVKKDAWVRTLI